MKSELADVRELEASGCSVRHVNPRMTPPRVIVTGSGEYAKTVSDVVIVALGDDGHATVNTVVVAADPSWR